MAPATAHAPADLHGTVESRLRAGGQRYTGRRRALVELLARSECPLALPDIIRARGDLAQSSVYRNLACLERAGVVRRVVTEDEHGRYELAEDLSGHHHHLICRRCGRVQDLLLPTPLERSLDRTLDRLGAEAGFAEVGHRLDLIGLCRSCGKA